MSPKVQPQVQAFLMSGQYDRAIRVLDEHQKEYGTNNELLYLFDRGMTFHLASRYSESIPILEKAKRRYDELFTQSVTRHAASWLMNDYTLPYRGEDFERVMVNIFQSMNYALSGNLAEALVEARDVDSVITAINQQYPTAQRNAYRDDAFARLLCGIFYETSGSHQDLNDAWIDYQKAWKLYEGDYKAQYGFLDAPRILKENLVALAQRARPEEVAGLRQKFPDAAAATQASAKGESAIYLVIYHGFSPVKFQSEIFLPGPEGHLVKWAFPQYRQRSFSAMHGDFCAWQNGVGSCQPPQFVEDLEAIAIKDLENRKARILIKAGLRPLFKTAIAWEAEQELRKHGNDAAAFGVQLGSLFYNIFSEQADLRSWQTLPAQIWLVRLFLPPGEYQLSFGPTSLGSIHLSGRETKFLKVRTW